MAMTGGKQGNDVIGIIAGTDHGPFFIRQGKTNRNEARFLSGYREAAGLAGMGVQMLPVILTGQWPFPGTGPEGEEKRCLVGPDDGSGNEVIYEKVLAFYPALPVEVEAVVSFIPAALIQDCPGREVLDTGRLAACFDIAAWFVDSLPRQGSSGLYDLGKEEVRALSLGIWANILITWLRGMDILSGRTLQVMRLAICGSVVHRFAQLGRAMSSSATCAVSVSPATRTVEDYLVRSPGLATRIADTLACCPMERMVHPSRSPESLCRDILAHSLNFFQRDRQEEAD